MVDFLKKCEQACRPQIKHQRRIIMKWYQKAWVAILLLFLFSPVGIFLMWRYHGWNKIVKIVLSSIFGLWFLLILIGALSGNSPDKEDVMLSNVPTTPTEEMSIDAPEETSTPSPEPTPLPTLEPTPEPEPEIENEKSIDWDICINETMEELTDPEFFSYVIDVYIEVKESQITFSAVLDDSTSPDVALNFADIIIRRFGANARIQDSSLADPKKNYYGGLYDIYDIVIGVAAKSFSDDPDKWFVYEFISKGSHTKHELKLQKYYLSIPAPEPTPEPTPTPEAEKKLTYVANTSTRKFHYPRCSDVGKIKSSNRKDYYDTERDEMINKGYVPCKRCDP